MPTFWQGLAIAIVAYISWLLYQIGSVMDKHLDEVLVEIKSNGKQLDGILASLEHITRELCGTPEMRELVGASGGVLDRIEREIGILTKVAYLLTPTNPPIDSPPGDKS